MKAPLLLRELRKTCGACPSQWEGTLEDGREVYIRYRWGGLEVVVGKTVDQAIDALFTVGPLREGQEILLQEQIGGEYDGVLSESELFERIGHLIQPPNAATV